MKLAVTGFGGMRPILSDRLLDNAAAVQADNTNLLSGELRGFNNPLVLVELPPATRSAFRIQDEDAGLTAWITSQSDVLDVCRAPIVNDRFQRWYWVSPPGRPLYSTFQRIYAGGAPLILGIPAPIASLAIDVTGGVAANENRAYLYTFVSAYGEEGQPSPPALDTGKQDGTWTLSGFDTSIMDQTARAIETIRIYRSVTSITGVASFFFLADIPFATTEYVDTQLDADVAARDILPSSDWATPPDDLEGLVALANGILVGWVKNDLYFSEPYRPWAWPRKYTLSTEGSIVGVGSFGSAAIIATNSRPYSLTGLRPSQMSLTKYDAPLPCTSRRSIVSAPEGVYYSSDTGMVLAGPSGVQNITRTLVSRVQWRDRYSPTNLRCVRHETQILGLSTVASFVLDAIDPRIALTEVDLTSNVVGVWNDFYNGRALFMDQFGKVIQWDPQETASAIWRWRSKLWSLPKPVNLGYVLPQFDTETVLVPLADDHLGSTSELPGTNRLRLKVYADARLIYDEFHNTDGFRRLPDGFKAKLWQFELIGRVPVFSLELATTAKELSRV